MARSGRSQGGIIGKVNSTSNGKCAVTKITATGCHSNPSGITLAHVLVGAGGGSGGVDAGGGAGAGGLILQTCQTFTAGACIPVTIGGGGAAAGPGPCAFQPINSGYQGTNTVFGNPSNPITATGGGAGGRGSPGPTYQPGGSGGAGQAGPCANPGGTGNTPPSCATYGVPQGNNGGLGAGAPGEAGGGGGGAGAVGGNASIPGVGGTGGAGSDVTPTFGAAPQPYYAANTPGAGATCTGYFAGGGGGALYGPNSCAKAGGVGGGGEAGTYWPPQWPNPGFHNGKAGAANSSGGGGGSGAPGGNVSGAGGSGVVLIKALNYQSGMWPQQSQYSKTVDGSWVGS